MSPGATPAAAFGGLPPRRRPADRDRPGLSREALRAALSDLAEFGVVYVDSAADAEAVRLGAPFPVETAFGCGRWRVAEARRAG